MASCQRGRGGGGGGGGGGVCMTNNVEGFIVQYNV